MIRASTTATRRLLTKKGPLPRFVHQVAADGAASIPKSTGGASTTGIPPHLKGWQQGRRCYPRKGGLLLLGGLGGYAVYSYSGKQDRIKGLEERIHMLETYQPKQELKKA